MGLLLRMLVARGYAQLGARRSPHYVPLATHRRSLAAPPPSADEITLRLADPSWPACPVSHHGLIRQGADLPCGVSAGDWDVSSTELTAHLLQFSVGLRKPQVLLKMKPHVLQRTARVKRRNLLLEALQRSYTSSHRPRSNMFLWHLIHSVAPKHVFNEALDFAAKLPPEEGGFEAGSLVYNSRGTFSGDASSGLILPEQPPPVWNCTCGATNVYEAHTCTGLSCKQTHCALCLTVGHPMIFCRSPAVHHHKWTLSVAGSGKLQYTLPTTPGWLVLPPFTGAVLGVLEWADDIFKMFHKGSHHFWVNPKRALLASQILLRLGDDGRLH